MLLAVLQATDAAADAGLALVVLSQVLRIRQYGLQELERHDFHAVVVHLVDAGHADVLDHAQVGQVFLPEGHPEAGALDGREVLHQRLQLLVVKQVGVARPDVRIGQVLVDFHGFRLHPFSILIVTSVLGNLADVDFRVEVGGESLMMVARVAVHDVQILDFIEMVLGSVCRVHAGHTRVESAAEDGGQARVLETFLVGPLPAVFKMGHIFRFVIGRVQIVAPRPQASLHDGQVLVRQGQVHHHVGLEALEELHQFVHVVGIHLCCPDGRIPDSLHDGIALGLGPAGNHDFLKHFRMLGHFVRRDRGHAACADN